MTSKDNAEALRESLKMWCRWLVFLEPRID
jgi:hypothetical protein